MTTPADAATIAVKRGSMMSTPSWVGLPAGRNAWPTAPGTGTTHEPLAPGGGAATGAGGAGGQVARCSAVLRLT